METIKSPAPEVTSQVSEVLSLFCFASQLSEERVRQSSKSEVTFPFIWISFLVYCETYIFIFATWQEYATAALAAVVAREMMPHLALCIGSVVKARTVTLTCIFGAIVDTARTRPAGSEQQKSCTIHSVSTLLRHPYNYSAHTNGDSFW